MAIDIGDKVLFEIRATDFMKEIIITKDDIEILGNRDLGEIDTSIKKYYFKNIKTGEIIVSVYPDLRNLENIINVNDYEKC